MKLKPKVHLTKEIYCYMVETIDQLPFGVGAMFQRKRKQTELAMTARLSCETSVALKLKKNMMFKSTDSKASLSTASIESVGTGGRVRGAGGGYSEDMPWKMDQLGSALGVKGDTQRTPGDTVPQRLRLRSVKKIGSPRTLPKKDVTDRSSHGEEENMTRAADKTALADSDSKGWQSSLAGMIARELAAFKVEMRQGQQELKRELKQELKQELRSIRRMMEEQSSATSAPVSLFWGSPTPSGD
jgi:hypothetical protein